MNTLIIAIVIVAIYYFYFSSTERLENIINSEKKDNLVNEIKKNTNVNTTRLDFMDLLRKNNNTSTKVTTSEAFYELKFILKSRDLTNDDILGYLTDYTD